MKPTLILFDVSPMGAAMVRSAFAPQGITVLVPGREDYLQPLSALLGESAPFPVPPYQGAPGESVVVLCHLDGAPEGILARLAELGLGRGTLKAVLTPHNRMWNVILLRRELQQEREQFQRR